MPRFSLQVIIHPNADSPKERRTGTWRIVHPEGRFEINALPPGPISVEVSADGYSTMQKYLPIAPFDSRSNVRVRLLRACKIQGTVRAAESGTPIERARIMARRDSSRTINRYDGARHIDSSPDGTFEIPDLTPGSWRLYVHGRGRLSSIDASISLAEGESKSVDIALQAGGTVFGEAFDDNGDPLTGYPVVISRGAFATNYAGHVDSKGRFEIRGVEPGPQQIWLLDPATPTDEWRHGATHFGIVDVANGDEATVRVRPIPAGTVTLTGSIFLGEEPLSEHTVAIEPILPDFLGRTVAVRFRSSAWRQLRCVTDSDGRFEFEGVPPGSIRLFTGVQGGLAARWSDFRIADTSEVTHHVQLPDWRIHGVVTNRDTGEPVANASVTATWPLDWTEGMPEWDSIRGPAWTTTDENGRYTLYPMVEGPYVVEVETTSPFHAPGAPKSNFVSQRREGVVSSAERMTRLDFELSPGGTALIRIVGTGRAGQSPVVHLYALGHEPASMHRHGSLRASFEDQWSKSFAGLQEGRYYATCVPSAASDIVEFEIRQGETTEASISIERGVEVRFEVVDENGRPILTRELALIGEDADKPIRLAVDEMFLEPAKYRVIATADGFRRAEQTFEIDNEADQAVVRLQMQSE